MLLGNRIWKGEDYALRLGPRKNGSPMALWSSASLGRGDFMHLCHDRMFSCLVSKLDWLFKHLTLGCLVLPDPPNGILWAQLVDLALRGKT